MRRHSLWLLPLALLVLITPFTPYLDLAISRLFFNEATQSFASNAFLEFFYQYGEWPAFALAGIAMIFLVLSFFSRSWKHYRNPCLILVLSLVIGAGLIVNGLFKEHWGRPRPRQVTEFGGESPFFPFYKPNFGNAEHSKSFPCGHCSMGFYFLTLAIIGYYYRNKALLYLGVFLGLLLGGILSYIRIAQGGHFLSDTLVSAVLMWILPLTLLWLVEED